MKQEDKELLIKELSARLNYGVRGRVYAEVTDGRYDMDGEMIFYDAPFDVILDGINTSTKEIHVVAIGNEDTVEFIEMWQTDNTPYTINDFKPYLFPLSNMTEEQKVIYGDLCYAIIHSLAWDMQAVLNELVDWLNKNHFDYRGLIEKGLAIDATGLKIY